MTKKRNVLFLVFFLVMILSACGMTQELDQSLSVNKQLTATLTEQDTMLADFRSLVEKMPRAYEDDVTQYTDNSDIFTSDDSKWKKNMDKRHDYLKQFSDSKKELGRLKKELKHIVSKQAVDVDNETLSLIQGSLAIIQSNYDAITAYLETGLEQETDLRDTFSLDSADSQLSLIQRTYGSVLLIVEEAHGNISYTLNLIDTYNRAAATHKK